MYISSFCYIILQQCTPKNDKTYLAPCAIGYEVETCTSALQCLYFLNCIIPSYYHNFKNILPTTDTHIKYKSATHNEPCHEKTCCLLFVNRAAD